MKKVILIHGTCDKEEYFDDEYPSLSNSHWFPWLQKQLLIKHIHTYTPEIPEAFKPEYEIWKKAFERYEIDDSTTLVGHSCGGGFLVRWLSEKNTSVSKVILVAPWLDPERSQTTDFFDFKIDSSLIDRVEHLEIFLSNDDKDVLDSVDLITSVIPGIPVRKFENMGHFTQGEMKTNKFPELLQTIIRARDIAS